MAHTHACQVCGDHYACDAPFERNDDGWPDPVCITRMESDPKFQQCGECAAGRLPCDSGCGRRGTHNDDLGEVVCADCETTRNEAAYERSLEDYYGGSGPVTLDEQYQAAAAIKRSQR